MAALRLLPEGHLMQLPIAVNGQKPSSKSLDQGVTAEVVEHNMRGRYSSDKTSDEHIPPNSYCVMYRFIYLYSVSSAK